MFVHPCLYDVSRRYAIRLKATTPVFTRLYHHSTRCNSTLVQRCPNLLPVSPILQSSSSSNNNNNKRRGFSKSWTGGRGHDLTNDLFDYTKTGMTPKINVSGYDENGFIVKNMIQKIHPTLENDSDGSVYMNGSIIVFPTGCFLWKNVYSANDVTLESLLSILLVRPHIEYLFIGCNDGYGSIVELNTIQNAMRLQQHNTVVVEQMQLYNAIGTFNLLNAEDRQVAAALVVDSK